MSLGALLLSDLCGIERLDYVRMAEKYLGEIKPDWEETEYCPSPELALRRLRQNIGLE
jgi:hypothetical protein